MTEHKWYMGVTTNRRALLLGVLLVVVVALLVNSQRAVPVKAAVLAVTHDEKIYDRLDRVFDLRDGHLGADHAPDVGGAS